MRLAASLLVAAACGDNLAEPSPEPELTLLGDQMVGTLLVTNDAFAPDDCAVIEQCVDGPGVRRLLRFDTVTANVGDVDLALGGRPPIGEDNAIYTWSPCHGHHHIRGYALYELRDARGRVVGGHKQAFCLQDTQQVRPDALGRGFTCEEQGLSAGWADVYNRDIPCQWIDVTSVPPGTYTLSVEVNALERLPDGRHDDNTWTTTVSL